MAHVTLCSSDYNYTQYAEIYFRSSKHTRVHAHAHTHTHTAGKPKKAGALITICLMLGPDFISDQFVVETSDHARLRVSFAMNNYFMVRACSHVYGIENDMTWVSVNNKPEIYPVLQILLGRAHCRGEG